MIPVYQRDYIWEKKECLQLWCDILEVVSGNRENHFIGSAICKQDDEVESGTVIIDGQQRMTTLFLLFRAIVDLMPDKFGKRVLAERYLINRNAIDDTLRLRLRPVANDKSAYRKIMAWDKSVMRSMFTEAELSSHIVENYFYLHSLVEQQLKDGVTSLDAIVKAIEGLGIIKIVLGDENPQLIFESINSTGKSLSSYVLVRNYVLMRLPYSEQTVMYDKYWKYIERNVYLAHNDKDDLAEFLLCWLLIKRESDSFGRNGRSGKLNDKSLYDGYKEFFDSIAGEFDSFGDVLSDMLSCSESYSCIHGVNVRPELRGFSGICSNILNDTRGRSATLVLMWLHHMYVDNRISLSDLVDMSKALLCYCVRARAAWTGQQSNIGTQTACLLLQRFNANYSDDDDAVKVFCRALTSFSGAKSAFVSNESFIEGLSRTDLYQTKNISFVTYLLYEINRNLSKEIPARSASVTVEHIMPQTLNDEWFGSLSVGTADIETEHATHVHMLGNLCLTAYNSELSNHGFAKKREQYEKSSFLDTRKLSEQFEWDFDSIDKRTRELAGKACELWSIPDEYVVTSRLDEDVWYGLDTDFDSLYECVPTQLVMVGSVKAVSSWPSFMEKLLGELWLLDAGMFDKCALAFSTKQARIVSKDWKAFRRKSKIIGTDYYVNTDRNSKQLYKWCIEFVRLFSDMAGMNFMSEIQFKVKRKA